MNILSDLTRHLIIASKNLRIEPKLTPLPVLSSNGFSKGKPHQILPPKPFHEAIMPPLMIQKQEIKPLSIESLATSFPPMSSTPRPSFNLGSIEQFAEDNSVSTIICDGPMKPVKIKREGKLEQTSVMLSRPEIDHVINAFSQKSNLSIKPVFRAKMDNLSILALVSSIESRFMLTINH
ncbi:MAG: hypothetical protein KKE23_00720 [Nanoarchaeota archaeon]|nr:hypothetical protein [Nanoarchaeota archaeon]